MIDEDDDDYGNDDHDVGDDNEDGEEKDGDVVTMLFPVIVDTWTAPVQIVGGGILLPG